MRTAGARRHDRFPAPADRRSARAMDRDAGDVCKGAGAGAHVRLPARGRDVARRGDSSRADPRRTRSCSTTKAWSRIAALAGRVRAAQGAGLRGRPGAGGRRVHARIIARRPSHRGTVSLVRELVRRAEEVDRVLGIEEIMKVLPHRYPFLLVDRILEFEEGKRIVGLKNVTINEPFFQGHFPGHPIMPGVLIIEAMAQVGGMLLMANVAPGRQGRVLHVARQREVAEARAARRPAALRAGGAADPRHDVQDARRREGRRQVVARRTWPRWCATDEPAFIRRRSSRTTQTLGSDVQVGPWRDRRRGLRDRR